MFDSGYTTSNIFEPFPDRAVGVELQKMCDTGDFPFFTQGSAWFNVVKDFVTEWIHGAGDAALDEHAMEFYQDMVRSSKGQAYEVPTDCSKENMINLLSQCIFVVTAHHEVVVTIIEYTQRPSFCGFRGTHQNTAVDKQSFLILLALTATTAFSMPMLVGKYANFFGQGGAPGWEIKVWSNFQEAIQRQGKAVQEADKKRIADGKPEYKSMDPTRFEVAVSV